MSERTEALMLRAVELSRRGFPAPNPRVGCVIANGGEIVGEGWHDHAGGPHAEAVALAQAGKRAEGAHLFCTLEPCSHHGRTPPCTEAIVAAKVARVSIAVRDPNEVAAGGLEVLQGAGVECDVGLLADQASEVNEVFLVAKSRKRPFVVVKSATTNDGFIARSDGASRWITGEEARAVGHRLRAELGCVLVGRVTVETDDPRLTARLPGVVNQPLRAVLDPRGVLGPEYKVFSDGGRTVRFVRQATRPDDVEVASGEQGFDLGQVLDHLYGLGMIGVLVEGGGETAATFFRQGLVDKLERFTSSETFGSGRPWLGMNQPELRLKRIAVEKLGRDLHESFRVLHGTSPEVPES